MIREAQINDLKQVSVILKEVHLLHQENRSDIFKELKEPIDMTYHQKLIEDEASKLYVQLDGDIVIGYMTLKLIEVKSHPVLKNKKIVKMEELALLKNYQGKGFGKSLFNKAIDYAKEIDAEKLDLQVWDFNIAAKEFYKKRGMKFKIHTLEYIV